MNFVRSSNGDVVTFRYSPNNQITFSESVVALTATVVYQGATLVDSVFGAIPAGWQDSNTDITQLTIGTSATTIGSYAFNACYGLTGSLNIPNNVTSINSAAFQGCEFTSLTLGNGVTSIGDYAFSATSIAGSITIPNSVTSIGSGAFRTTSFSSLTLGSSVTSIGSYAFSYSGGLTGPLTIPNSVTSIGTYAFRESGWNGTSPLTIPGTVSLASYAFYGASFNGLNVTGTSINANQFLNAAYVSGPLTIANTVTSIGSQAFYNCQFTGSITIPNSVTSIGSQAFYACPVTTYLCYITKTIIDATDTLDGSSASTIQARTSDATWTAGAGQTIGGKSGITVIKNL